MLNTSFYLLQLTGVRMFDNLARLQDTLKMRDIEIASLRHELAITTKAG